MNNDKYMINELSIADLKAAYDFVREDLNELKTEAHKGGITPDKIPAYKEVKEVEFKLYHKLLNITRDLK
jgi:hypothetical protein